MLFSLRSSLAHIFRIIVLYSSSIAILSAVFATPAVNADCQPCQPQQFYGSVTINGSAACACTTIAVKAGDTQLATTITDSQGGYGYTYQFFVAGCSGIDILEFYVDGVKAPQTASCSPGASTQLNLVVNSAELPSSGNVTIATDVLGQTDSLALYGGILQEAKTLTDANGIAAINIPSGCRIGMQIYTSLTVSAESPTPTSPTGTIMLNAYRFAPSQVTFGLPATMTLKYNASALPSNVAESDIYMAAWDGTSWSTLPSFTNTSNDVVIVQLSSLAQEICLLGRESSPGTNSQIIAVNLLSNTENITLINGLLTVAKDFNSADSLIDLSFASNTDINLRGLTQLTVASEPDAPAGTDNSSMIRSYSFSPSGATFQPAATLKLKYETGWLPAGAAESGLYIAYWDGSVWQSLACTVDTVNRVISASISHFTIYAIMYSSSPSPTPSPSTIVADIPPDLSRWFKPTTPSTPAQSSATITGSGGATFVVSDLNIAPAVVKPGEQVTATIHIANTVSGYGSTNIILKINGKDEANKDVKIAPQKSQPVSFIFIRNEPGRYTVNIAGLSSTFEVKQEAAGKEELPSALSIPIMAVIIAGGLMVIIMVIVFLARH